MVSSRISQTRLWTLLARQTHPESSRPPSHYVTYDAKLVSDLGSRHGGGQFSSHRIYSDAGGLLLREVGAASGIVRRLAGFRR